MRRGRVNRRSTTSVYASAAADPGLLLGASIAWRADDAQDNGVNTTALPSYIGNLTLNRTGTGQVLKTASVNFGSRISLPFAGTNAGYSGSLALSASMSFVSVYRATADSSGVSAFTVGGAVNTGSAAFFSVGMTARKVLADAVKAGAAPIKVVSVAVFNAAGATHYANSYAPAATASAGALVGDTMHIGALDTAGTFTLTGEWRKTYYFNRALTASEAAIALRLLGAQEGVAIAA